MEHWRIVTGIMLVMGVVVALVWLIVVQPKNGGQANSSGPKEVQDVSSTASPPTVSFNASDLGHRTLIAHEHTRKQPTYPTYSSYPAVKCVPTKQSFWQRLIEALQRASRYAPMEPVPADQTQDDTSELRSSSLDTGLLVSHPPQTPATRRDRSTSLLSSSICVIEQPPAILVLPDATPEPEPPTIEMAGSTGSGGGKREAAANSRNQGSSNRSNSRTGGTVFDDHGDSRDSATRLTLGDSTSGEIDPGSDEDYFNISATEGDQIVFDINAATLGSPLDSVLELYDSRGRRVAYADDDGDTLDSYMEYRVESDGEYYLKVRAFGRRGGRGYFYDLETSQR